jgi:hypothetical protein
MFWKSSKSPKLDSSKKSPQKNDDSSTGLLSGLSKFTSGSNSNRETNPHDSHKEPSTSIVGFKYKSAHSYHCNPAKRWGYYDTTAKAEYDVIRCNKKLTSSTTDSSSWTISTERLSLLEVPDHDSNADESDDPDESDSFFVSPEGINRVPFTTWELDVLHSSKLASYYQHGGSLIGGGGLGSSKYNTNGNTSYDKIIQQTSSSKTLLAPPLFVRLTAKSLLLSSQQNTPHNSPTKEN